MNSISFLCQGNGNIIKCEKTMWIRIETFCKDVKVIYGNNVNIHRVPYEYYDDRSEEYIVPIIYYSDSPFIIRCRENDHYAIPVPYTFLQRMLKINDKVDFSYVVNEFVQYINNNISYLVDKIVKEIIEQYYEKIIHNHTKDIVIETYRGEKLYYAIAKYYAIWSIILQLHDLYPIIGYENVISLLQEEPIGKEYRKITSENVEAINEYLMTLNKQ